MLGRSSYMCICMSLPQLLRDSNSNKGKPPQQLRTARLDGLTQMPRAACAALPPCATSLAERKHARRADAGYATLFPPWDALLQRPQPLARTQVRAGHRRRRCARNAADARPTDRTRQPDRTATAGDHLRLRRLRLRLHRLRRRFAHPCRRCRPLTDAPCTPTRPPATSRDHPRLRRLRRRHRTCRLRRTAEAASPPFCAPPPSKNICASDRRADSCVPSKNTLLVKYSAQGF